MRDAVRRVSAVRALASLRGGGGHLQMDSSRPAGSTADAAVQWASIASRRLQRWVLAAHVLGPPANMAKTIANDPVGSCDCARRRRDQR